MTVENLQLSIGSVLADRYTIIKRLGGGGMGNVYLAHDRRLADTPRAVKEMIGQFADDSQRRKAIEDFDREAQLLASLEHPSIPTIYDYFVNDGRYYLVMKYINGRDLEQELKSTPGGKFPERTVIEWAIQLCDVFDYIHNLEPQIIYRDMKPANVMLDSKQRRVMLVDFGIARFVNPQEKNVTAIGTMGYAPPELFAGKVEARSDIYSLGATMFHLLTGEDPQTNPLLLFDFTRFPRPIQLNPQLSKGIDEILAKMVAHRPSERYATASEMKQVLEAHLRSLDQPVFTGPESYNARLTIIQSNTRRLTSFAINKEQFSLGRKDPSRGITPDVDLTPFDTSGKVSRRHGLITFENGKFFFEDLGSSNGSFINGIRLQPQMRRALQLGDQICLGETILRFTLEG
jgi:eukaryotic-like serine/threonine-protein kinase